MKTLFTVFLVSMMLMPGKIKVTYDYDKDANFGEFKTFSVALPSAADMAAAQAKYPTIVNQINEKNLQNAIISQMESRGYTQSETPDLMVTYNIKIQTQTEYQANTMGMGPGLYGGGFYGGYAGYAGFGGMSTTTVTPENYETGSIVIDVVSTKTNTLVWYGAGSGIIGSNSTKNAEQLPGKVAQIFEKYFWSAGQSEPTTPIPGTKK
ncbi:MAG TPA: DUF4136 domain-containing protein [Bacteroidales bacterium]